MRAPVLPRRRGRLAALATAVLVLVTGTVITTRAEASGKLRVQHDVTYLVSHGVAQRLDVYLPPTRPHRPQPAVLFLHGGAWVAGDKSRWGSWPAALTRSTGWSTFNVNYNLRSTDPLREQPSDVLSAIRWVRRHAAGYGVDPTRLALIGESAGGQLAELAGTRPPAANLADRVSAVVSLSGFSDLPLLARDAGCTHSACDGRRTPDTVLPSAPRAAVLVQAGLLRVDYGRSPGAWREASPITYVDAGDAAMLLISSSHELTPIDQDQALAAALRGHGEVAERLVVPGSVHAVGLRAAVSDRVTRFLRARLHG